MGGTFQDGKSRKDRRAGETLTLRSGNSQIKTRQPERSAHNRAEQGQCAAHALPSRSPTSPNTMFASGMRSFTARGSVSRERNRTAIARSADALRAAHITPHAAGERLSDIQLAARRKASEAKIGEGAGGRRSSPTSTTKASRSKASRRPRPKRGRGLPSKAQATLQASPYRSILYRET